MPDNLSNRLAAGLTMAGIGSLLGVAAAGPAWAWGHTGHVSISRLAILNLPAELPQFVRSTQAAVEIGELGPEPDESKTTGIVTGASASGSLQTARTAHDTERDIGYRNRSFRF